MPSRSSPLLSHKKLRSFIQFELAADLILFNKGKEIMMDNAIKARVLLDIEDNQHRSFNVALLAGESHSIKK